MTFIGVDGCSAGWVGAERNGEKLRFRVFANFAEILDAGHDVIAIDIPIGLAESGPRLADQLARQALGWPRCCSVFSAPIRPLLPATSWREATATRRRVEGKGLSQQSWGILGKIREVDAALRQSPKCRARVFEVHPELCFWQMAGGAPMRCGKKGRDGRVERLRLLTPFGVKESDVLAHAREIGCKADDIIDSLAALWTAGRIAQGAARAFPADSLVDREGIRMTIWA